MMSSSRVFLFAVALVSVGVAFADDAAPKNEPEAGKKGDQLEAVIVRGKHDVLSESDRRLKELQKSLPDLNSDAPRKESLTERAADRVVNYVSQHKDPNKLDDSSKAFLERMQDPLDHQRANTVQPPLRPDAKDYADPLCQAGSCPP